MKSTTPQARFETLYLPVHPQLEKYCRALLFKREDYKDLMSETVCIAYEKFDTLRKPEDFKYFLFGIASNLFKKKISRHKIVVDLEQIESEARYQVMPNAIELADVSHLYAAIDLLPDNEKEIIALFELSGFKLQEIADMKDMPLSTVKTHLSRGRQRLFNLLNPLKEKIN